MYPPGENEKQVVYCGVTIEWGIKIYGGLRQEQCLRHRVFTALLLKDQGQQIRID